MQQSNPEAGGILNRAERASPVLLGTPSPPCQHTPEQVGAPAPFPNSPRSPSDRPLFRSGGFPLASSGFPHPSSPTVTLVLGGGSHGTVGCLNAQSPCTIQRPSCTSPRHPCSLVKNGKWGERTAQAPRPSPSFAVLPNTASPTSPPQENWQCWGNGEPRGQEPEGASGWVCGGISVSLPLCLPAPRAQDFVPHSLLTMEGN